MMCAALDPPKFAPFEMDGPSHRDVDVVIGHADTKGPIE